MSYLCSFCGNPVPNGTKRKVVRVERPKTYIVTPTILLNEDGEEEEVEGSRERHGSEIVMEKPICQKCILVGRTLPNGHIA